MASEAKKKAKDRKDGGKDKFNFVTVVEEDGVNMEEAALFWALDNEQPLGWDQEKEVDYSELMDRSTASMPSLFNYGQSTSFEVKYLGGVKGIQGPPPTSEDQQTEILETIEAAQCQGRLPWVTHDYNRCSLNISRYGLKATDEQKKRVMARHPLHHIGSIVYYEDTFGHPMLAVLASQTRPDFCDVHVYQTTDENHAKDICLTLAQAFESVFTKLHMEQQQQ